MESGSKPSTSAPRQVASRLYPSGFLAPYCSRSYPVRMPRPWEGRDGDQKGIRGGDYSCRDIQPVKRGPGSTGQTVLVLSVGSGDVCLT